MDIVNENENIAVSESEISDKTSAPQTILTTASGHNSLSLPERIDFNFRCMKRKLSFFFNTSGRSRMVQIVYVSAGKVPKDYILALQKQYPNKEVKVIIPIIDDSDFENEDVSFEYFYKNKTYVAKVVKYLQENNNIWVYGIYSDAFSKIPNQEKIYDFNYMAAYAKCARIFVKRLKADIIHSDGISFCLGEEFEKKKSHPFKLLQVFHSPNLQEVEPFWAAINLADKFSLEKITKDRIVRKYLAKLFNLKNVKKQKLVNKCLDYFYDNYEPFRQEINPDRNIEQNIILRTLNKRIIKMFPDSFPKKARMFNPQYYSSKKSNSIVVPSAVSEINKEFEKKTVFLRGGFDNIYDDKIIYNFRPDNFRNIRTINKHYLQREFAKDKIQSKFTDSKLISDDEIKICGHLDSIKSSAIIYAKFEDNADEEEYKSIIIPVLKAFEYSKDIQFILNVKNASKNLYIKSLIDFFEEQHSLDGRWLYIDGQVNLPQFAASSDIILIPNSGGINTEEIMYTALKYGCVPVIFKSNKSDDILKDIFNDMNEGCCFKLPTDSKEEINDSEELMLKVLNFYFNNSSSWNLIIENAMNFDSSWNFEKIQAYNNVYDKLN